MGYFHCIEVIDHAIFFYCMTVGMKNKIFDMRKQTRTNELLTMHMNNR